MNAKLYTTCAISDGEVGIGKLVGLEATDPAKSALWSQGGMGGAGELRPPTAMTRTTIVP